MKDKDKIHYYRDNNILKGPDDLEPDNNGEPQIKCPFCGEEDSKYYTEDIREFNKKYIKIPFRFLIYYGLIECGVRKCKKCGAMWHGDLFIRDNEDTFKRSIITKFTLGLIIAVIMSFLFIHNDLALFTVLSVIGIAYVCILIIIWAL